MALGTDVPGNNLPPYGLEIMSERLGASPQRLARIAVDTAIDLDCRAAIDNAFTSTNDDSRVVIWDASADWIITVVSVPVTDHASRIFLTIHFPTPSSDTEIGEQLAYGIIMAVEGTARANEWLDAQRNDARPAEANTANRNPLMSRYLTWVLPKSIDTINAALWQYLRGKIDGWCDYDPPHSPGPGVLVYHLRQSQLGEFATVTLSAMGVQQSKIYIDLLLLPPLAPKRNETNEKRRAHLKNVVTFVFNRMAEDDEDLKTLAQKINTNCASDISVDVVEQEKELQSLQYQLAEARENLRLLEERKAEYVLEVDIPLQLNKEEQRLKRQIAELEKKLSSQ